MYLLPEKTAIIRLKLNGSFLCGISSVFNVIYQGFLLFPELFKGDNVIETDYPTSTTGNFLNEFLSS
jgi:hypothetical protein